MAASNIDQYLKDRRPYPGNIFVPQKPCHLMHGNEIFWLMIEARRKKELMGKLVRLILCVVLLVPMIAISYAGHSDTNYDITRSIRSMFKIAETGSVVSFESEATVYQYLEHVLLNALHPKSLYNGDPISAWNARLCSDQQTLLIGVARIRQHRVVFSECKKALGASDVFLYPTGNKCLREHLRGNQDTKDYNPVWEPVVKHRHTSSATNDGWAFRSANYTKALTYFGQQSIYDGGGYIINLGENRRQTLSILRFLRRSEWLDFRTRAMFIEITLLNPSVNKFIDVKFVAEQGPTGSFTLRSTITPLEIIPFDDLHQSQVVWVVICLCLVVLVWFVWIGVWIHDIVKARCSAFRQMYLWIDFVIIIAVLLSLIFALIKFIVTNKFASALKKHREDEHLSIQNAAFWTLMARDASTVTQAFVFVKLWKLLMFTNKRLLTFALTLKLTMGYLVGFVIIIAILLCAFATSGWRLFGTQLWEFSSFLESMISLVDQIPGAHYFVQLLDSNPVFGPLFAFTYSFFALFIGVNIIVAMLDVGVHEAKKVVSQRRVVLTYCRIFQQNMLKAMPCVNAQRKQIIGEKLRLNDPSRPTSIHPSKLLLMKEATCQLLKTYLEASSVPKMREMANELNKELKTTGQRLVNIHDKFNQKGMETQVHMTQLRIIAAAYLRKKLGHDMKAKEFRSYADVNRALMELRVQKLEQAVEKLAIKLDHVGI